MDNKYIMILEHLIHELEDEKVNVLNYEYVICKPLSIPPPCSWIPSSCPHSKWNRMFCAHESLFRSWISLPLNLTSLLQMKPNLPPLHLNLYFPTLSFAPLSLFNSKAWLLSVFTELLSTIVVRVLLSLSSTRILCRICRCTFRNVYYWWVWLAWDFTLGFNGLIFVIAIN